MQNKEEHLKKIIAIIPARAGSKRVPGKNIKEFAYYKSQLYLVTEEKLYIYAVSE